jgi:hypothetical protein
VAVLVFFEPSHLDSFEFAFGRGFGIVMEVGEFGNPGVHIGVADMGGIEVGEFFGERESDGVGLIPGECGHGGYYRTR